MLKKILVSISAIMLLLIIVAIIGTSQQPETYKIERTARFQAPVGVVFPIIVDLGKWKLWSPWFERDPKMEVEMSQPSFGINAYSQWKSKTEGSGKQTISAVDLNKSIEMDLEFYTPWEGRAFSGFKFEPVSENITQVTWTLEGTNKSFTEKFFYMIMDYDAMIGKDYERGFERLRPIVEENTNEASAGA